MSGREWYAGREWYHFGGRPTYSLDFFDRVRSFATGRDLHHIDTFRKFTNPADYPLCFDGDTHFRRRGYELMAEGIVEGLLDHDRPGLRPSSPRHRESGENVSGSHTRRGALRVGFNCYLLSRPSLRGWTRYTTELVKALSSLDVELYLYSHHRIHESHMAALVRGNTQFRSLDAGRYGSWEQFWLPRQARRDRVDVFHSPFNYGLPVAIGCPTVLTLHDAIDSAPHSPRRTDISRLSPSRVMSDLRHWTSRRRASHVITVSQHARLDLQKCFSIPQNRISVIYEAAGSQFHSSVNRNMAKVVSEKLGVHRPFLFYVGGFDDRKNIQFLLTAFAAADLENASLVLAGTRSPSQGRDLDSLTRQLNISDRVSYLGWVDDYELAALYATAEAFVYPSRYEGFGLQLVEAMALGCPVLASDVTSLPEILGDGGETFPLDDPERLTQLLRRVMHDSAYREALSTRSRQRGQHFSWRKTASDTLDVYARLAGR